MKFDQEQIQQLEEILSRKLDEQRVELIGKIDDKGAELIGKLDEQRIAIMSDVRSLLQPIKDDLAYIKQRLDTLFDMESEDIRMNFKEIKKLKVYVKQLEQRIAALER